MNRYDKVFAALIIQSVIIMTAATFIIIIEPSLDAWLYLFTPVWCIIGITIFCDLMLRKHLKQNRSIK